MREAKVKIIHKLMLLLLLLVVLVSISILGSAMHLSKDGKEKVSEGVTEKLEELEKTSVGEFNKFTKLANEGIRQASGLVTVDKIIAIALDNQEKMATVIGDAVESIGKDVTGTLESQDIIISKGFDDLLASSTDSMNEIMKSDRVSKQLLADVATHSMTSLNASIIDSLERLTMLFEFLGRGLKEMVYQNNDEIEGILIELINILQQTGPSPEEKVEFAMEAFSNLKKNGEERSDKLFSSIFGAFDEQKAVMDEELKLVNKKIRYAIRTELGVAEIRQKETVDQVTNRQREKQMAVLANMNNANELLRQAVAQLKTNMPIKLKKAGDAAGNKIMEQTSLASKWVEEAYSQVVNEVKMNMNDAVAKFESAVKDSKIVIERTLNKSSRKTIVYSLVIAFFCTCIAVILGFFITRSITDPLTKVVVLTEKMAGGDFTQTIDVDRSDEIGQFLESIQSMGDRLSETVRSVSEATDRVNLFALEISTSVQEQASIAAEQSSSVSEISATIEEFSQTSSQIAENAESVAQIATNTLQETEKGVDAVKAVVMRMNEISKENQRSINEIIEVGEKSKAISKFMEIIKTIADQTKLIAFNAALEASSAGDAGKRFGVVATEIRNLADSVMDSTREIEVKINEIQNAFNHLVIASEKGSKKVEEGLDASSRTAEMLAGLLSEAKLTEDAAKQISMSTQQQKTASEQVVIALREIAAGAKQSTESINQVNKISTSLADLSGGLKNLVGKFRLHENKWIQK